MRNNYTINYDFVMDNIDAVTIQLLDPEFRVKVKFSKYFVDQKNLKLTRKNYIIK